MLPNISVASQARRTLASLEASPSAAAASVRAARAAAAAVTLLASRTPAWGCSSEDEKAVARPSSRVRADRKAARSIGAPLLPLPPLLLRRPPARCGVVRLAAALVAATADIWSAVERRRRAPRAWSRRRAGGCARERPVPQPSNYAVSVEAEELDQGDRGWPQPCISGC